MLIVSSDLDVKLTLKPMKRSRKRMCQTFLLVMYMVAGAPE